VAVRLSWCFLPALLLAGCSPPAYGAVRDWAGSAASATAWQAPRTRPAPAEAPFAERTEAISAMQAALDAWFTAPSAIAADGLVRQPEDPLAADAAKAAAVDAEAGHAVGAIGGLLVTATKAIWRAPQTAGAIRAADPAVRVLLHSLANLVGAMEDADTADRAAIAALYAPLEAETRDPAARQAIRDWRTQRQAELEARISGRSAYKHVLARIGEGQALLLDRASHLSQAETARRLRSAEETLRRAAALLPRAS
jgi:hypothetical protein